ncbi:MAG: hypothetical protein R3E97_02570 [Candidatus Eisenbacteria bacterium]
MIQPRVPSTGRREPCRRFCSLLLALSLSATIVTVATPLDVAGDADRVPDPSNPARYQVRVPGPDSDVVEVQAAFVLESDVIGMVVHPSAELPNGEADLLEQLEVRDADGQALTIESLGVGDWRVVDGSPGMPVRISYRIRLEHDRYPWGPGIDEIAYRNDDGIFFTGGALFVLPSADLPGGAHVRFELPRGWDATVPWPSDPSSGDAVVRDGNGLRRNCFFLGTPRVEEVTLGEFRFVLVLTESLKDKSDLFVEAMRPILPGAKAIFGGMPRANRYLVVLSPSERADGGAFADSYSMLLQGTVNEGSSVVWAHGIAHELLHFWNGHTLVPSTPTDEEWFKEGFTDYYTILLRSRLGMEPRETTFRKMEGSLRRYVLSKMLLGVDGSLREAGRDKHRNRMFVYGGGTLVAFTLDVRIREATENRRGLEDAMKRLYREFALAGRTYEFADIVRTVSEVSGVDQSAFLGEFVDGSGFLDAAPYFESAGLQLDSFADEFYVSDAPNARPDQVAIREAIFGYVR